jgi:hypothetical protein
MCWSWIDPPHPPSPSAARSPSAVADRVKSKLEGLEAGEFVVVDGTLRARPGQPVTIIAVDKAANPLPRLLTQGREGPGQ